MNRHPSLFTDPEKFDPTRWLLPRAEYQTVTKNLWTYSSGPQSCIGRELSLTSIFVFIFFSPFFFVFLSIILPFPCHPLSQGAHPSPPPKFPKSPSLIISLHIVMKTVLVHIYSRYKTTLLLAEDRTEPSPMVEVHFDPIMQPAALEGRCENNSIQSV